MRLSINSLLILFCYIANHNKMRVGFYVLLLIIEWCNLLYLPVQYASNTDSSFDTFASIVSAFNYFRLVVSQKSELGVLVLFILHGCIIVYLTIASIFVMVVGRNTSRTNDNRFLMGVATMLSSLLIFMAAVLVIPMLESFIFPLLCHNGERVGFNVSYMQCGSPTQIVLSCLGILFTILTFLFFYIVARVLVDDYWLSTLPWAGEGLNAHVLHEVPKFLLGLYLAVDITWVYSTMAFECFLVLQLYEAWQRIWRAVTYSRAIYVGKLIEESMVLVVYAYVVLGAMLSNENALWVQLFLMLMGICIGLGKYVTLEKWRHEILRKNWASLKNAFEAEDYVSALCDLCYTGQQSEEWKLVLNFLLFIHMKDCTRRDCKCKSIRSLRSNGSSSSGSDNSPTAEERVITINRSNAELWMIICEEILEKLAEKWENSRDIKMHFCYFESIVMKNYFKAYYWLLRASEIKRPFVECYLIFRMKHILSMAIVAQEAGTPSMINVPLVLRFQKLCSAMQKVIAYCTTIVISFWTLLELPRINVSELYRKGQKITVLIKTVHDYFKLATECNSEHPYNYLYYGRFLTCVLNSETDGKEWIAKGMEIMQQLKENKTKYKEDLSKSPDTAVIVISGNLNSLGIVRSANEHVKKQLGFEPSDLIDRNISRIMPKSIGEVHDMFLLNNVKAGVGGLLHREVLAFSQTKQGLILPVCLEAKTLPGLEHGLQYIGFVKRDVGKIKSRYIKLPSQYKAHKLAYIMTGPDKCMIGMSKHACELFGLSTRYISRKKGATTTSYHISKLAPELGSDENLKKLEVGMEVILNTQSILEYLDYDHLTKEEEKQVLSRVGEKHRAFVMEKVLNPQGLMDLRVFMIVDLEQKGTGHKQHQGMGSDLGSSDAGERIGDFEAASVTGRMSMDSSQSQSYASSSSGHGSSSKSAVMDLKKGVNTRERTTSITRLLWAIFIIITLLVANVSVWFGLYVTSKDGIHEIHTVVVDSLKRLTHFDMAMCRLMAYMNVRNGLEPSYTEDGELGLNAISEQISSADTLLNTLKNDEYNLEISMNSHIPSLSDSLIYRTLNMTKIHPSYTYYTKQVNLNHAVIEVVDIASDTVQRSASDSQSTAYVNNFVQQSSSDTLSSFEMRLVYVFANSLTSIHTILSESGDVVFAKFDSAVNSSKVTLIVVICLMYSITFVFSIVFVPIIWRIHRNKRNLLELFAGMSFKTIHGLAMTCRQFLKTDFAHLREQVFDSSFVSQPASPRSVVPGDKKAQQRRDSDELRLKRRAELARKEAEKEEVTEGLLKKQQHSPEPSSAQGFEGALDDTEDERRKEELNKAEKEKDDEFIAGRKKSIRKVPLGMSQVTFVVVIVFAIILGYSTKMLMLVIDDLDETKNNLGRIVIIYKRFTYLADMMLFFRGYLRSMDKYLNATNCEAQFNQSYSAALENENKVSDFKTYPSTGLGGLSTVLEELDSSRLCQDVYDYGAYNNLTWCKTTLNGVLMEGLSHSVSFCLAVTYRSYLNISLSSDAATRKADWLMSDEFQEIIEIFVRIYNPLFDWLADKASSVFIDHESYNRMLAMIDYIVMIVILVAALILLAGYFIKRMEEELFMARGVLALLPENMIKSASTLEALIDGHQLNK